MSIIYEALKKAQEKFTRAAHQKSSLVSAYPEGNKSISTSKRKWFPWFSLIPLAVVTGVFTFLFVHSLKLSQMSFVPMPYPARPVPYLRQTKGQPPPPISRQEGNLSIQGVMVIDDKPVVLINEEIYEEGEYIQGKRIISITLKEVKILDKNQIHTLRVK